MASVYVSFRAMSVISPVFLWGVAAIAVPLFLHLCRKRKFREVSIGTLRFLREATQVRRKRSRLEEWLLLLFRCVAVALLALIFVRPFLPGADKRTADQNPETLVLLDASGSMTDDMREHAMKQARLAMRSTAKDEKVSLAQFSDRVEALAGLEAYKPRAGAATDVGAALDWALDRLLLEGKRSGRVVLIGHFAAEALPSEPPRVWPAGIPVEVVSIDPPAKANAAVHQVNLLTPFVTDKMEIEAVVRLPIGVDRTVTLEAEGLKLTEKLPKGAKRVVFKFRPPREQVRGTVRITSADPWPADDSRAFALRWTEPRSILLVDGNPGSTPFDGNAYFIEKALLASGAEHGKSPFQPEIVYGLEGRQGLSDVSKTGAIALCGVTDLSVAATRALREYVDNGGGLIHILDSQWTLGSTAALAQENLFPSIIARSNSETEGEFSDWDRDNPALASFDGREGGDLRSLRWRDGFKMAADDEWKMVAEFDSGHAAILEKIPADENGNEGRVMVIAHPLTREWTDLPREPLYVPFVKGIFASAAKLETSESSAAVLAPGADESRAPGIYDLADGAVEVVASAADESSVTPASVELVRNAYGLPEPGAAEAALASLAATSEKEGDASATRPREGELWPWLAVLLLLWLAAENFLATRRVETTSINRA